jgi:hypothetical protein
MLTPRSNRIPKSQNLPVSSMADPPAGADQIRLIDAAAIMRFGPTTADSVGVLKPCSDTHRRLDGPTAEPWPTKPMRKRSTPDWAQISSKPFVRPLSNCCAAARTTPASFAGMRAPARPPKPRASIRTDETPGGAYARFPNPQRIPNVGIKRRRPVMLALTAQGARSHDRPQHRRMQSRVSHVFSGCTTNSIIPFKGSTDAAGCLRSRRRKATVIHVLFDEEGPAYARPLAEEPDHPAADCRR